jgi:predicted NUDIX family NTP pyrophosphohydrolase
MPGISAGLLLYRKRDRGIEVFLIHPGGPFWEKKDLGSWSIPKGLVEQDEDLLDAAKREFHEETGFRVSGPFLPLSPVKLKNGKTVYAWAAEGDLDAGAMKSNTFTMEWPPHSGRQQTFPEADRGAWYTLDEAVRKITAGQAALLDELRQRIKPDTGNKD